MAQGGTVFGLVIVVIAALLTWGIVELALYESGDKDDNGGDKPEPNTELQVRYFL